MITIGLFTRPISEHDFTVSESLLQNIIIFIFNKMGYPNAKSDSHVNRPYIVLNYIDLKMPNNMAPKSKTV